MCKIRRSEKDIRSLRLSFYNLNWCKTYFFFKNDFLIGKIDDELYFDVKMLFLSFHWQVCLGHKKLFTLVTYSHAPCKPIWLVQILFVRREKTNPTQKSASKSDDANIVHEAIICNHLQPTNLLQKGCCFPKLSESIDWQRRLSNF